MNVVMDEAVIHSAPNNDVLGDSFTIPGTNDEAPATFAKALLRLRIITSPQSGPVAQITRDNSGTSPLDLFLQLGAKWHQWPPGPALVVRLDSGSNHAVQVPYP